MPQPRRTGTAGQASPRGLLRFFLRMPILLYRLRLGWLLDRRFLLLTHTGRKSGASHSAVLEILRYDQASHCCYIASGWGKKSQWYQNVLREPRVRYTVGVRQHAGIAEPLGLARAEQELRHYGDRHPAAIRKLTKFMIGEEFDGSDSQFGRLADQVPVLQLAPVADNGDGP